MGDYLLTFAGSFVSLCSGSREAEEFAAFLFNDIRSQPPDTDPDCISIEIDKVGSGEHAVRIGSNILYRGTLGVKCAALLFDQVIYHLLNHADSGIALHAGAIADKNRLILLPGQSGSGKSSLTGWLSTRGYSYLTDELVFIPEQASGRIQFFTRPVCLKPEVMPEIRKHIPKDRLDKMLTDKDGAIIPHRSLNPRYSHIESPPQLILLPVYREAHILQVENVSGAQASMALMTCHANARNLKNHGFDQIIRMVCSLPVYRLTYGSFASLGDTLNGLLDEPARV